MDDTTTLGMFSPFEEASKALLEVVLGTDLTDQLAQEMLSYSDLLEQNNILQDEVASLKENLPFRDKYENLQKEFRKVASERDSLRAQELETTRIRKEYTRLKSQYQSTKGQLATLERQVEDLRSSTNAFSALESLYQTFKKQCDSSGVDIRRIPCKVNMQFQLQDSTGRGANYGFVRTSATNWQKANDYKPPTSANGGTRKINAF